MLMHLHALVLNVYYLNDIQHLVYGDNVQPWLQRLTIAYRNANYFELRCRILIVWTNYPAGFYEQTTVPTDLMMIMKVCPFSQLGPRAPLDSVNCTIHQTGMPRVGRPEGLLATHNCWMKRLLAMQLGHECHGP
jgi:hypothetical protein